MCEFCTQHGEGKKWYLHMENYSQDLLEQEGRLKYMSDFLNYFEKSVPGNIQKLETWKQAPIYPLVYSILSRNARREHFGQVVTIEEVEQVFHMAGSVVRLPCVCRRVTTGERNARYCYALSMDKRLSDTLDDSFNLETLSPVEALESVRMLDKEGLVHSVWTFKTPYIGGLCNCDQDCMAFRITHERRYFKNLFRGEAIAWIDPEDCNGCKACMRQCQYGAMRYSATNKKVLVDARACYGCGVCRAACHHNAIQMQPRIGNLVAANLW